MSGATWDERSETDWLASNGRWYPESSYPRTWGMTSLPPAPGHGEIGSILRRVTAQIVGDEEPFETGRKQSPEPSRARRTSAPPKSTRPAPTTRRSAGTPTGRASSSTTARASDRTFLPSESQKQSDTTAHVAEIITQRTYKPKVAPGPPPPSALPPPPGRVRDVDNAPPAPPAPSPQPPGLRKPAQQSERVELEDVAGEWGKAIGVAKRRIRKAINEAAESGQ